MTDIDLSKYRPLNTPGHPAARGLEAEIQSLELRRDALRSPVPTILILAYSGLLSAALAAIGARAGWPFIELLLPLLAALFLLYFSVIRGAQARAHYAVQRAALEQDLAIKQEQLRVLQEPGDGPR